METVAFDEARDLFVALAENSGDLIGFADLDGQMVYINTAGRTMLGIDSLAEAQQTKLLDHFRPEDREYVTSVVFATLESEGSFNDNFQFRNAKTGAPIPVSFNLFRMHDRQGRPAGVATISRDRSEREHLESGLRLLAVTGGAALNSLDFAALVQNIANSFVREYASYCIIDVLSKDGQWQRTAAHRDAAMVSLLENLSQPTENHQIAQAIRTGKTSVVFVDAEWLRSIDADEQRIRAVSELRVRSFITVAIITPAGEIVGAITCARDESHSGLDFQIADAAFVEEVGRRAGLTVANARLYERERRIAVEMQSASLPTVLPRVDHLHLDAEYRPASDEAKLGGDWYDAFALDDGRVAITVGDVIGHGLNAAVTMTKLRQAMQSVAMMNADPMMMLEVADKTLRLFDQDGYATALAAVYDRSNHEMILASAGHPGPAVRLQNGTIAIHDTPGLPLGLRNEGGPYENARIETPPGSTMVFFTDGLTEATRDSEHGYRRLTEALGALTDDTERPARAIVEHVLEGASAADDIAVLVAQIGVEGEPAAVPERQTSYGSIGSPDHSQPAVALSASSEDGEGREMSDV